MKQSCDGCFYYNQEKQQEPCYNCHSYCNWVSKDFLNSVPDTPVTLKTGVKFDQEKPQWTLVPFKAFDHVVEVLTIGARKYAPDNWKKVPNARQRYIDAAFRHMSAYAGGEKLDAETGKNHLAHAVCCLLFLLAFDLDSSLEKTNG
jgi:lysine/ornithine N-monooxygenase